MYIWDSGTLDKLNNHFFFKIMNINPRDNADMSNEKGKVSI